MRRALILLAAADAAAKFALEKKGQKVLNVKLYETGYTFTNRGDKDKTPQTLREISGCSFGKKRDNGRREITLVEDKGYIITSSVPVRAERRGRANPGGQEKCRQAARRGQLRGHVLGSRGR
jgi:hypothetical protein